MMTLLHLHLFQLQQHQLELLLHISGGLDLMREHGQILEILVLFMMQDLYLFLLHIKEVLSVI